MSSFSLQVNGRCPICLEGFNTIMSDKGVPKKAAEGGSFLERSDLVKINLCYHRFHLFCLCHSWFDQLEDDFDDKGNVLFEYAPPKDKLCPVCRREVSPALIRWILRNKSLFVHSEINDKLIINHSFTLLFFLPKYQLFFQFLLPFRLTLLY